jgi:hypothetical protein
MKTSFCHRWIFSPELTVWKRSFTGAHGNAERVITEHAAFRAQDAAAWAKVPGVVLHDVSKLV